MKERTTPPVQELLKPYRAEIDRLDDAILKLLGERFAVVRKVAQLKIKHNIPAFLGDRVNQVRDSNAKRAKKYGIDPDFIRTLYTLLIYQSCSVEDRMKADKEKMVKKKKQKG